MPAPPAYPIAATPSRLSLLAAAAFVCAGTGAINVVDRMRYGEWTGRTGGDTVTQATNVLLIALSLYLFRTGYRRTGGIGAGGRLLIALSGYLFLSVQWSVDPETTLRRCFVFLFFVVALIGIANALDADSYMRMLRRVILFLAVASLGLLLVPPAEALMLDGTLRGVFSHKNVLGQVTAVGVLASLHGMRAEPRTRWACAATILTCIVAAGASRSATALTSIFAFLAADAFVALFRRGGAFRLVAAIAVLAAAALLAALPNLLLDVTGKDATLTGRTDLWVYVEAAIAQRPLLGWGYSAFWSPANPVADEISRTLQWVVPEAHNGLLGLLLHVGAVGSILYLIIFARNVRFAILCLRTPARELGRTLLIGALGIVLLGVSEEVLVDPSQLSAGVFFTLGLMAERAARRATRELRLRPAAAPLGRDSPLGHRPTG